MQYLAEMEGELVHFLSSSLGVKRKETGPQQSYKISLKLSDEHLLSILSMDLWDYYLLRINSKDKLEPFQGRGTWVTWLSRSVHRVSKVRLWMMGHNTEGGHWNETAVPCCHCHCKIPRPQWKPTFFHNRQAFFEYSVFPPPFLLEKNSSLMNYHS